MTVEPARPSLLWARARKPERPSTEQRREHMLLTASLTTGVARVTSGILKSTRLVDEILGIDHVDWETTLMVGDVEFHRSKSGPYPDHQMRISVRPSAEYAALNYMDNRDSEMTIANSFNPKRPVPDVNLIFNGTTGAVFPRTAAIRISDARAALIEWLDTRKRPTCIEWRPYDSY
ncbi:Imm1 family immunity protein [Amycolatopsis sp. OK19-0408]|uniref:Imm1 family immunity protein n=1 Tax=Amycolatopsis iheyensis TaxID=2945988 RepID=A0A9X2SR87_9PSEU|nr:Imm1 family immunity protein [Amycolatopsis iheyensis]MCR6490151.1 Imm1 family immunity protein [Amycolatopsis iheyensis]